MAKEVIVRTEEDRLRQLLEDEREELKLDVISPGVAPVKLADVTYDMTADIAGIVREVQDKREFQRKDGSDGQVRNIKIQDATADLRCALWGDLADMQFELGDPVLIRNAQIQDGWKDDIEASVGYGADVEVLEELEIEYVTVRLRESGGTLEDDEADKDPADDPMYVTYDRLEALREFFDDAGMDDERDVLNEAHALVQEYEDFLEAEPVGDGGD